MSKEDALKNIEFLKNRLSGKERRLVTEFGRGQKDKIDKMVLQEMRNLLEAYHIFLQLEDKSDVKLLEEIHKQYNELNERIRSVERANGVSEEDRIKAAMERLQRQQEEERERLRIRQERDMELLRRLQHERIMGIPRPLPPPLIPEGSLDNIVDLLAREERLRLRVERIIEQRDQGVAAAAAADSSSSSDSDGGYRLRTSYFFNHCY